MSDDVFENVHLWTPRNFERKPDATCCRASVSSGTLGYKQCGRKVKVVRRVVSNARVFDAGFCSTHDPVAVAAKKAARHAKWDAEAEQRRRETAERKRVAGAFPAYTAALLAIANGHNDARQLAMDALCEWGDLPSSDIAA